MVECRLKSNIDYKYGRTITIYSLPPPRKSKEAEHKKKPSQVQGEIFLNGSVYSSAAISFLDLCQRQLSIFNTRLHEMYSYVNYVYTISEDNVLPNVIEIEFIQILRTTFSRILFLACRLR